MTLNNILYSLDEGTRFKVYFGRQYGPDPWMDTGTAELEGTVLYGRLIFKNAFCEQDYSTQCYHKVVRVDYDDNYVEITVE